jgi:hypothetical protein
MKNKTEAINDIITEEKIFPIGIYLCSFSVMGG